MSAGDIYNKTALGVREVSDRKLKVSPRQAAKPRQRY
jgi:hypothetical protein